MNNGKKFLSDVSIIQKARDTKKLVIFIGSGVSINSGIPSWGSMLEEIKSDIGIDRNDTEDALQIAQIYFNERKHKEYIEKIRDILHYKKKQYNQINEVIFDLQPEHVVTTNYDDLLEQVIRNRALPFSVVKKDNDFPYSSNSNLLVKIHGDLENDDFILKEDDYLDYETNHPLFEAFIKSVFSTKVVLFVGYSFSDINLKIILQKVRNILGKNYQSSYLVTHNSFSDFKVNYLKEKGVNVLSYEDNRVYIDEYLNSANARSINYKKEFSGLEKVGVDLHNMLTFLNIYDRFEEDLSKHNYIDQMRISLKRFSEMNTLPYFFIANLYPFNNTEDRVFYNEHRVYSLTVKNKSLVDFLLENTEFNNNQIEISESYLSIINNENEIKRIKGSLKYVTDVLNYSAITNITFEDYRSPSKSVVLYNKSDDDCECFTCLIDKLKLNKLIDKLLTTDITDASDVKEDARLAYAHYKSGNIYQAYSLFEEIAQKAWHSGKYIVYFISKYNLKRLGHIILWKEYKNLSETLIQEITYKADRIDLDSVYRQINDISKEEALLIKIIRDNEVLERSSDYVLEEYEKIKQMRIDLENGRATTADKSQYIIDFNLTTVDMFYNRNFIVSDVFSGYIDMYNMGVKALLINYVNYRDYSKEVCSLDYSFCFYFIYYGKYSELKDVIIKYKIDEIIVDEKEKIFEIITNYYSSFVASPGSFGKQEINHKMYNQIRKAPFDYKFVDIFDNISLLLGIVKFEKEKFDVICNHLLTLLNYTDVFHPSNIAHLEYIFKGNAEYISNEFVEKILEILKGKSTFFIKDILDHITNIFINKSDEDKINNSVLVKSIIKHLEDENSLVRGKNSTYLERLYLIVDSENKKIITDKITSLLEKEFSHRDYWVYAMNDIIEYESFFDKYLEFIYSGSYEITSREMDYTFVGNQKTKANIHFKFVNFLRLLYKFDIQKKYSKLIKDSIADFRDYMDFYLDPEGFYHQNFKIEWLFCTYDADVHQKLSKIEYIRLSFSKFIKEKQGSEYMDLYIKYYL